MHQTKFSMNALLLVVIIFAAVAFFFMVKLVNVASQARTHTYEMIEGTDYAVCNSSWKTNGIYRGGDQNGKLCLEGVFGTGWGQFVDGDTLYINESMTSELGLMTTRLDRIDLKTMQKDVLLNDCLLRGQCASGELVCTGRYIMESEYPQTNGFCRLYALSADRLSLDAQGADVIFLDPETGEVVLTIHDDTALTCDFEERYLSRTLEEVRP